MHATHIIRVDYFVSYDNMDDKKVRALEMMKLKAVFGDALESIQVISLKKEETGDE